ncbi:MAG: VCBS repeat-containing protein, partial [Planctomycetia bacterium]|nr:VCBS repeat-containing protein [Planctomycetia bacterium]
MKSAFALCLVVVVLCPLFASSGEVAFEVLPGAKTGLKPAMEQWYELEMKRQGGPGKQSHGWWPWGIRVFDFDRDGALDILASHHGVPHSLILRSHFKKDGALRFTNATTDLGIDNRDLPGADDRPWIWDFDGDGWLDIAGISDEAQAPSAWNLGGKKFTPTAKTFFSPLSHPREVLDLNGDGYLDLDGGSKGRWLYVPESRTFRHDPTRRFARPEGLPAELVQSLEATQKATRFFVLEFWTHAPVGYDTLGYDPRPIDLDGDGRFDVVVHGSGGYGAPYLGRYLLRGADDKLVDRTRELGLPESGAPILVEDLTGDGRPEILVA